MTLFDNQIAEIKISYSHTVKPSQQVKINGSADVYDHVVQKWEHIDYRESFAVLLLSRNNGLLGISWTSLGGISGCIVDPKIVFQVALRANASAVILLHNHPSGALKPSQADINITHKLKEGGSLLDITVLDHIILTSENYISMADEGYF